MKKHLLIVLMVVVFATGCGKKEQTETAVEPVSEETSEMAEQENAPADSQEAEEPGWMKREEVRPEGAEEWDDEDDDEEFEPETAEQAEGAALKAELEDKYGFEIRNLEKVSFLNYLNYEELYKILHFECDGTYVEFVTDSMELTADGGRCPIIIDGYELDADETVYLSYRDGHYNVYSEFVTQ